MYRLYKKLFLFFIITACYGAADIQMIENLQQILPLVDSQSLVIFDLHQSLICSLQMLGREEVFQKAIQTEIENGFSKKEAFERISSRYNLWQQFIDLQLSDKNAPAVINALHQKQILTLACSIKDKIMGDIFNSQLKSLNVDLSNPLQHQKSLCPPFCIPHHLLFLPFEEPMTFLAQWLYSYQNHFKRVFYVSAQHPELEKLDAQFLNHPLTFTGLHYQIKTEACDLQMALLQEQYLNSLLSDRQAELILLNELNP